MHHCLVTFWYLFSGPEKVPKCDVFLVFFGTENVAWKSTFLAAINGVVLILISPSKKVPKSHCRQVLFWCLLFGLKNVLVMWCILDTYLILLFCYWNGTCILAKNNTYLVLNSNHKNGTIITLRKWYIFNTLLRSENRYHFFNA